MQPRWVLWELQPWLLWQGSHWRWPKDAGGRFNILSPKGIREHTPTHCRWQDKSSAGSPQCCCCACRPVYTKQEWDEALQEDGSISGFVEIVDQIEQRVSTPAGPTAVGLTSSCNVAHTLLDSSATAQSLSTCCAMHVPLPAVQSAHFSK